MTVQVKPTKTQPFYAAEVKLQDGVYNESQDAKVKYLLSLDPDRLLAHFMTESGLQPRAPVYSGWETRPLPVDALSFYLSGASRLYKLKGDEIYLRNLKYFLDDLNKCQARNDPADLKGTAFFWDRVIRHRKYATGGNSESEYSWPIDTLRNTMTPFTEETCNVYKM